MKILLISLLIIGFQFAFADAVSTTNAISTNSAEIVLNKKILHFIYPLSVKVKDSKMVKAKDNPGFELTAEAGTPVLASEDGIVTTASWSNEYGNLVEIKHAKGYVTKYAHLMKFAPGIYTGAVVKKVQVLGNVGTTGQSTNYQLHFDISMNGKSMNPEKVIGN